MQKLLNYFVLYTPFKQGDGVGQKYEVPAYLQVRNQVGVRGKMKLNNPSNKSLSLASNFLFGLMIILGYKIMFAVLHL